MRIFFRVLTLTMLLWACVNKVDVSSDPDIYYTCSMDPQVVEQRPGKCPICKMELTPVKKQKGEKIDELQLSEQQIQLGNIQTDTIRSGMIGDQVVLSAALNFDQTKSSSVSARINGRIEKLYFKNIGDYIKKGSPVYELYSEELNNAKQEFLLALDRKKTFANEIQIDFQQLVNSAKNKLLLWGMTEVQLAELEHSAKANPLVTFYSTASGFITTLAVQEGDYVMEGGLLVTLADLSSLWVEAQVYSSQLSEIDLQGQAMVRFPHLNNKEIKGRIEFANPEINPDTRINLLRVSIPNTGYQLKPGMAAEVILKSRQKKSLTLPIDAVIQDNNGATVWIKTGENVFKVKMVEVGLESDDRIEIRSGLTAGDIVVITGAYLLNSEYIFKKGTNPMAGHSH